MKRRLDLELAHRGLAVSRNTAQEKIRSGNISVNGEIILKMSHLVSADDTIDIKDAENNFVGRGGKKLEGALTHWNIDCKNKIVVDVGSSTGGFTESVLLHGAKKVYAIDVGRDQLAEKLRNDARVIVMEKTDIRKVELVEKADIAVIDVSFISLEKILEKIKSILVPNGIILALVKPQFEVGKEIATKYKGVITDEIERQRALTNILTYAKLIGLSVVDTMQSPITGSDGNIEYFAYLKKG